MFGHTTSGSGGKKTFKRYLKSEQTNKQTDKQTDKQTHGRTFRLIESIGPEGGCFKKAFFFLQKQDLGQNRLNLQKRVNCHMNYKHIGNSLKNFKK